jgi:prephenate dehydratase
MLPRAKVVPCARSLEVFDRVKRGAVDGAVIPIENSLAGSVAEHFDLLLGRDVHIVREFRLRIVHNLIALPGAKLGDVRRVFSHPVALDQCRDLFARNPKLEPVPFYDTAGSVKHVVAEGLRDAAAIASRRAAEVYAGKILKAGIEDDKKNFTRFFLIERGRIEQGKIKRGKPRSARNADKTSLAFSLKNIPGALFKALSVFALRDISLSKIESRPMRGRPWEYVFFVDLLRGDDEDSRHALRHLSEVAELVKVLGIYPKA